MESYQTLNRELVLTVCDLRKENFELRNLVTSLTAENMRISSDYGEFKRNALGKFTKISEILGSVSEDLFPETSKKLVRDEMTRKRYTMMSESATALGNLLRSSPEKMPRKLVTTHVNVRRRRGGQKARETAAAVTEDTDDFDASDMSIEDIRDWLNSDQIEIAAPITEDPVETQPIEEPSETPEEVPENQEPIYKSMPTILEENSKSISHNSLQVTQVNRFTSSTPHSNRNVATEISRMEISPIASTSKGDERCLLVNGEKCERIFAKRSPEVSEETSVTLVLPESVTVRRRERFVRELTHEEPKEPSPEKLKEDPKEPTPEKPKEEPKEYTPEPTLLTPNVEEPKSKTGKKRTQRKRLADVTNSNSRTNWTVNSPVELPNAIPMEKLDDDITPRSQRPRRQAAPRNLAEPSLNEKLRRK